MSLALIKAEIDKSLAIAREYMRTYRQLREQAALEEGAKKFRTSSKWKGCTRRGLSNALGTLNCTGLTWS